MRAIWAICGLAAFLAAAFPARAQSPYTPNQALYCANSGGTVELRRPEFNTNGSVALKLAKSQPFCKYTAKDGYSSISVFLATLTSTQPTLAALAYYAKVKFQGETCHGSPGSCYCSQLGGTDLFGGINVNGGGWVLTTSSTDVLDTCVFPDLSSIDSYGLFYHSAGIVRGKDLSKVLIYHNPN